MAAYSAGRKGLIMSDSAEQFTYCPHCATPLAERELFGRQRQFCPKCDYIHFLDPKVAATTFITRVEDGVRQVLLILRTNEPGKRRWSLPAGFVDRGEDPSETAVREAREETGLRVEIIGLVGTWTNGMTLVHDYAARVTGGVLIAGDDAGDARWFSPDALPDLAFDEVRDLIADWTRRGELDCLVAPGMRGSTR
jgi:8-oxo-dGTP diphosphatase